MIFVRLTLVLVACRALITAQSIQPADLWKQSVAEPDRVLTYGKDPLQFGELRLPRTKGPHAVVVLVHGGCFVDQLPRRDRRDTSLEPLRPLAAALADLGIATWNLEYRRAGNPGGGWPGSFSDLAAGTDFLRSIANANQLDLHRVVVVGHSSGGMLAYWLAARPKLARSNPLYAENPLPVKGFMNIDAPPDLAAAQPLENTFCPVPGISQFMGGTAAEQPARYAAASAISLLPIGVPQTIVAGGLLKGSPQLVSSYEAAATAKGDSVAIVKLEGAGHFDMLDPVSKYGKPVLDAILALLK